MNKLPATQATKKIIECENKDCKRGKGGTRKTFQKKRKWHEYCCTPCRVYCYNKRHSEKELERRIAKIEKEELKKSKRITKIEKKIGIK